MGVLIGSAAESSPTPNVTFTEPDGTSAYLIPAISGYTVASSGIATVNGASVNVPVRFSPVEYPIVFVEVGLPAGSNWSVTVSNVSTGFRESASSNTSTIVLFLLNGTYRVAFDLPAGYTGSASSTQLTAEGKAGAGPSVRVVGPSIVPPPVGTGGPTLGPLLGVGIAAVAFALAVLFLLSRRPRSPKPGEDPTGPRDA